MRRSYLTLMFVTVFVVSSAPVQNTLAIGPPTTGVLLIPDVPSGQPVGKTVSWTVGTGWSDLVAYRFSVAPWGEPPEVMYDFSPKTQFEWTPIDDGVYIVTVSVRNLDTGERGYAWTPYVIVSRVNHRPVVTPTNHPLVALYSAPPCQSGDMRVVFKRHHALHGFATHEKPCRAGHSMNFYIGGMRPDTTYLMRHEVLGEGGATVERGPLRSFRTGSLEIDLQRIRVIIPSDSQTSMAEPILLQSPSPRGDWTPIPVATELDGEVTWYYDVPECSGCSVRLTRPLPGGTMLLLSRGELREIDLAGHTVRETNALRVNAQLVAMGQDPITGFHHEAILFPNGQTLVLCAVERVVEDAQGPGPMKVLGDIVVALDGNWQVIWAWNSFDHLDVARKAVLDEKCSETRTALLCPDRDTNDWLHSNSITYSPADGNLLLSMRNQDWVVKIDYRDGGGTGDVIWRLGPEGDFAIESDDPFPWFSHQHDAHYEEDRIIVYDNGTTRCATDRDLCYSRGQLYNVDETSMTASLALNADLRKYAPSGGAAQNLRNGNSHFTSGSMRFDGIHAISEEVFPDGGTGGFSVYTQGGLYRSFRMRDLYTPPAYLTSPLRSEMLD